MLAAISPEALPALRIAGTFFLIINLIGGAYIFRNRQRFFGNDPNVSSDIPAVSPPSPDEPWSPPGLDKYETELARRNSRSQRPVETIEINPNKTYPPHLSMPARYAEARNIVFPETAWTIRKCSHEKFV